MRAERRTADLENILIVGVWWGLLRESGALEVWIVCVLNASRKY